MFRRHSIRDELRFNNTKDTEKQAQFTSSEKQLVTASVIQPQRPYLTGSIAGLSFRETSVLFYCVFAWVGLVKLRYLLAMRRLVPNLSPLFRQPFFVGRLDRCRAPREVK